MHFSCFFVYFSVSMTFSSFIRCLVLRSLCTFVAHSFEFSSHCIWLLAYCHACFAIVLYFLSTRTVSSRYRSVCTGAYNWSQCRHGHSWGCVPWWVSLDHVSTGCTVWQCLFWRNGPSTRTIGSRCRSAYNAVWKWSRHRHRCFWTKWLFWAESAEEQRSDDYCNSSWAFEPLT